MAHYGYRTGIVLGMAVAGIGALMFYPAALLPSYALFLLAFFTLASGITLLQVAANAYVSLLGEPRLASSRLNLAQAFNSLGTTLAPVFGGMVILVGVEEGAAAVANLPAAELAAFRVQQAQMVQMPYVGLALALFLLAAVVFAFHLPPLLQGVLADRIGVQLSFVLPLLCYAFVAYYGYRGSRLDGVESAAGAARPQFIPH